MGPDTWVSRLGLLEEEIGVHYLYSLYWATQTVTTVGYGDMPAYTTSEMLLSFCWELIGVAFFSFIIGNFSSIISRNSEIEQSIAARVQGFSEISRKAQIPFVLSKKIKQYVENN